MQGHCHTPLQALCPPVSAEHPTHSLCHTAHLQSVLTQQRSNCREGTPLGTSTDSQRQAVKEHMSPVTHAFHTCQTHSLALTTSHHRAVHTMQSSKATMSQNGTHQTEASAPVSAGPSAGDLTEESVVLESVLPHRAGYTASTQGAPFAG